MKLTRYERTAILRGDRPALIWPGDQECPVEPGDEIRVASEVSVVVHRIRRNDKNDHMVLPRDYVLRDFRPRLLRRVPPVFDPPQVNESGDPIPPTADAIADARLEGSYTTSSARGIADAGEGVGDETLREFDVKARAAFAEEQTTEQALRATERSSKQLANKLRRLQAEATRYGVDLSPQLVEMVRIAQREIAKKRAA